MSEFLLKNVEKSIEAPTLGDLIQNQLDLHDGKNNYRLGEYYRTHPQTAKKGVRVEYCNTFLEFSEYQKQGDFKYKLTNANRCNTRYCSICDMVRARETALLVAAIAEQLKSDCSFIFLTLTIPNPRLKALRATTLQLNRSFKRLMEVTRYKKVVSGYSVGLEFLGDNTPLGWAHPHIHALLAVHKPYSPRNPHYITADQLRADWLRICQQNGIDFKGHTPQVNLKRVYGRHGDDSLINAIFESSKYSVKHTAIDILLLKRLYKTFYEQTKGLQTFRLGGSFKALKSSANEILEQNYQNDFEGFDFIRSIRLYYDKDLHDFITAEQAKLAV